MMHYQKAAQRFHGIGLTLAVSASLLSGCAAWHKKSAESAPSETPAPVSEAKPRGPLPPVAYPLYRVKAGDTLYGISLKFDKDYRELAKLNKLDDKFTIYVDQVLKLESGEPAEKPVAVTKPLTPSKPVEGVPAKPVEAKTTGKNGHGKTAQKPAEGAVAVAKTTPSVSSTVQAVPKSGSLKWSWPVTGQLLKRFSNDGVGSKGIDIAGTRGDPVKAAADGVVVYAGEGLVGYGRLIILRHNDEYITAYAHNDKLIAAEGQKVKQGQTIAELGSSGAERDKLHFEIRYQGKPVDPLGLLPGN